MYRSMYRSLLQLCSLTTSSSLISSTSEKQQPSSHDPSWLVHLTLERRKDCSQIKVSRVLYSSSDGGDTSKEEDYPFPGEALQGVQEDPQRQGGHIWHAGQSDWNLSTSSRSSPTEQSLCSRGPLPSGYIGKHGDRWLWRSVGLRPA